MEDKHFKFEANVDGKTCRVIGLSLQGERTSELIIPSKFNGLTVTEIGDYAFSFCKNMKSLFIPNTIIHIGENVFICCSVVSITIEDGVTAIWDSAFSNCDRLKNITIPNSVTSIGKFAFSICQSLSSIQIPDGVIYIGGGAFSTCTSLKSLKIPAGVSFIETPTFLSCHSLSILEFCAEYVSVEQSVFYGCEALRLIITPKAATAVNYDMLEKFTAFDTYKMANNATRKKI